jgi:hypothetical protein
MYFNKFVKGIPASSGLTRNQAEQIVQTHGLRCNWWLSVHRISPDEIAAKLNERNLEWHLQRYDQIEPDTGQPFRDNTPYISRRSTRSRPA